MTPARFNTIEEIFLAAVEQESDQVSAFLDTACGGDAGLRREVEVLLASDQRAGHFIEGSSVGLASRIIQNQESDSLVGQTFGHYKISERIGTGGMGDVYLATDITAGRKAALKLLPLRFTGDAERLKRFQQEARAVVGLNHPNILTVYEIGQDHSIHYIASELIEGETLRDRLIRGPIELSEAVDVAIQVASALAAAHQAGIVHRDIKPENIMLRPDGYVKVLDFGIAKLAESAFAQPPSVAAATFGVRGATADGAEPMTLAETNLGSILGTVRYMSPEQACGASVDKGTDIWSLGVVLYETVTGHVPFTGDPPSQSSGAAGTPREVMAAILEKEPPPLARYITHPPVELQQIIGKTLRKDRKERYHSAHELLQALKDLRHKLEVEADLARSIAASSWLRWTRSPTALVLVLLVAALALALPFYWHRNLTTSSPPEKSIAVLPFENLSRDPDNAFFADGVQDEILTDLAKIADLKVISRRSVMQYKSEAKRNLLQIAHELGVANIVEGSVQRAGNRVRVNAQLVDARTDRHLWGQTYDRDLADVFAIQSEIAKTIADQLQAKLSPDEKNAIERPPTNDVTAFDLYTRAKNLLLTVSVTSTGKADLLRAADLLNQAVARDPSFFQAYCQLAYTHDVLYLLGFDHTSGRLASAEAAVEAASRLRPGAGEAHLARAENLYRGYLDYDGALAELEVARQTLPNDPRVVELKGYIERRRGRWGESTRDLERAIELDPRNISTLQQLALSYQVCRRYAEEKLVWDRIFAIVPDNAEATAGRALAELYSKADTRPLHQVIDSIRARNLAALPRIAEFLLDCALAERDTDAAKRALIALGESPINLGAPDNVRFNRTFVEGVIARMTGDDEKARSAFTAARAEQEKIVQAQPNYGPALCVLGLIDAGLGRKEEALREGRRAVGLIPMEKDAFGGITMVKYLAMIAAWVSDKDLACEQLAITIRHPSPVSYGQLKLLPLWDPLRGDPRFEKLVEEAKLPVALSTSESGARNAANFAPAAEKSIAVLPFENLSKDPDNAYFAEGIQDEILTRLSKIADLKVISRTSTQHYKSAPKNLPEIARELGVGNILEGRVQKSGEAVRVNVQLIKAANDSHLWAETYDRKLSDIFGVQSEIAKGIAESLQAKLTGHEEQALAVKPTNNPEAYDAYLRGLAFEARSDFDALGKAISSYEQAVELDPNFALAWARLSRGHALLYNREAGDITAARRDAAKSALDTAQKLQPDSPETLLALGYYQYWVLRDYQLAKTTFKRVQKMLPGSSDVLKGLGAVSRREGHWDQSVAYWEQALVLDPRNVELLVQAASTYAELRQFQAALKLYDRALDIVPTDPDLMAAKAGIYQAAGNLEQAGKFLSQINAQTASPIALGIKMTQLRLERNFAEVIRLLQARLARPPSASETIKAITQVELALHQRVASDTAGAKVAGEQARNTLEQLGKNQPDNPDFAALLSLAYAALGEKNSALKEAERAIMLLPSAKDRMYGPSFEENLALIQAMFGANSQAISTLARLLQMPYYGGVYLETPVTPALLRLDPIWDPLRADPAFQKLGEENAPLPEKSIAVLPFENASNEPNTEYLSEGIAEALINSLSELQQLRVIARPTAFRYKGKDVDPRQLGRELGVAAVLTGKVRQMQDALNVQVDLVDAVTGAEIWGAGYDRKIADLVAIKQAITQEVTAKLKLKLSGEEQRRLVNRDSTNPEAYQFYLRGRYFWNKRTSDGIKQAIEHFQQSIERDPNFALGYVGLADCYTGLTFYNFAAPHETMPRAKESAIKALALDNTLAEAHASLAHILMNYDWNWSEAEKEFRRSIELKPDYATAHQWYAIHYLTATGRLEEAVQEMKKALELDPASLVMNTFMGATLYYAGRYDEAIDQCRTTVEMDPNFAVAHWHLGLAYEQKQVFDKAIEEFKKAISLSGGSPLMRAALGRAYAESQKKYEANEMLNELNELAKRQYVSPYEVAKIYVALGNSEKAFQLLAKAYAEHSFHLVNLNVCPQLNSVRSDPRFQDLVQRVGLSR